MGREEWGSRASTDVLGVCKECRDCGFNKDLNEFHVHTRNADDTTRLWQSYCKLCQRERTKFYARQRRRRQGVPERVIGRRRDRKKGQSRYGDRVDLQPFVDWLVSYVDRNDLTITEISDACKLDEARLRRFYNGKSSQKRVSIGFVDRILVYSGTNTQLWELYPDA